jgi:hypothetical protein
MQATRLLWPAAAVAIGTSAIAGAWLLARLRGNPAQRERKRRLLIHREGRFADGNVTDVTEEAIFYSYTVRGVGYQNSQDVSDLNALLPNEPIRLLGPVMLKYMPQNPANSIVLCEEWSGFRGHHK